MRKKILLSLAALIILAVVFHAPALNAAARWLTVQDKLEPADLMIVLAGDDNGERVKAAVKLFKAGWAPKMLMSGGPIAWKLTSADWMKRQAVAMGVPPDSILLEKVSRSTLENALECEAVIKSLPFKKIILVTSPYHTRRARRVFSRVFPAREYKIISAPADGSEFNPVNWWKSQEDTEKVTREFAALGYYWFKGY